MDKKKNKNSRVKVIIRTVCIIVVTFIILSIISDNNRNYEKEPNTVYNYSDLGAMAFYQSVMEFGNGHGWRTQVYKKYARFLPDKVLMVCINPYVDFNKNEQNHILRKVNDGSTVLFIVESNQKNLLKVYIEENYKDAKLVNGSYNIGQGKLIISEYDAQFLLNKNVKIGRAPAARTILLIDEVVAQNDYKIVYFNEFYHGIQDNPLYDVLGSGVVLFITQAIFAVVLLMVYKGRRFGSPVKEMSIIKRRENENVFALAGLYERTGSPDIIFEVNIEALFSDVQVFLGYGVNNLIDRDELIKEAINNSELKKLEIGYIFKRYTEMNKIHIKQHELKKLLAKIGIIRKEL